MKVALLARAQNFFMTCEEGRATLTSGTISAEAETQANRRIQRGRRRVRKIARVVGLLVVGTLLRGEKGSGRDAILRADMAEMVGLEPVICAAPGRPFLPPMIYNAAGDELAEAEAQNECVMKSPRTRKDHLA